MKPEKVVFVDESLEKSFNELNEADPIRKSLARAITTLQEDAFSGRNVNQKEAKILGILALFRVKRMLHSLAFFHLKLEDFLLP